MATAGGVQPAEEGWADTTPLGCFGLLVEDVGRGCFAGDVSRGLMSSSAGYCCNGCLLLLVAVRSVSGFRPTRGAFRVDG